VKKKRITIIDILKIPIIIALLPVYLIEKTIEKRKGKPGLATAGIYAAICLTVLPIWIAGYGAAGFLTVNHFGFVSKMVPISGTGSMEPTLPKGIGTDPVELSKQIVIKIHMTPYPNGIVLFGNRYFGYTIQRRDIVVVENSGIDALSKKLYGTESGFVKRVIAIPGDTLEIRDGNVILNGIAQKEPYIARSRSTFGGEFLSDCKTITIPPNKYFIMGDNRKSSDDSRHDVGLIDDKDIQFVLPWTQQLGYLDKHWHDPTNDLTDAARITLDTTDFINQLNKKREEAGRSALNYEPRLAFSAVKRGDAILENDDFSFEATKSGYTMEKAVADAGYSNIVYGEWSIMGYYDANELIDTMFQFPDSTKFLTNTEYQDIGVAQVRGSLNSCPAQIIVMHFGGYVPPNYTQAVINSWTTALSDLKSIQPSWQHLTTLPTFYAQHKDQVDRIDSLIQQRIDNITSIVARINANLWLTPAEDQYVKQDPSISSEMDALAKQLNGK